MDTRQILDLAEAQLEALGGHTFDVLSIAKPVSTAAALNLTKIVSKLSPMLGNLIEFNLVELLNQHPVFSDLGRWERQDPGFPDAVFRSDVLPMPGFEIKAWYPLATEITARFKDSQRVFEGGNTRVVLLAWLPEHLIYGKPRIIDVCVVDGGSVARARDLHYHQPPEYVVIEPEDTSRRTLNLQQTNTSGYRWQGNPKQLPKAQEFVQGWGAYESTPSYQIRVRGLMAMFPYRLDTNFAKIDRIEHAEIEQFKRRVLGTTANGMTVYEWARLLQRGSDKEVREALKTHCKITEDSAHDLVE